VRGSAGRNRDWAALDALARRRRRTRPHLGAAVARREASALAYRLSPRPVAEVMRPWTSSASTAEEGVEHLMAEHGDVCPGRQRTGEVSGEVGRGEHPHPGLRRGQRLGSRRARGATPTTAMRSVHAEDDEEVVRWKGEIESAAAGREARERDC
jgi:hypothetical protein